MFVVENYYNVFSFLILFFFFNWIVTYGMFICEYCKKIRKIVIIWKLYINSYIIFKILIIGIDLLRNNNYRNINEKIQLIYIQFISK